MDEKIVLGLIGVRAAGKTTVIERIASSHLNNKIIFLGEEIKAYSLLKTNKPFFEHSFDQRDELRAQLGKIIASRLRTQQGITLIDMHLADYREGLDKLIQPLELLWVIDGFIFLDAPDEIIIQRRKKDPARGRRLSKKDLIVERQEERLALKRIVKMCGSLYWFVSTKSTLEATCQKVMEIIESVKRRE